MLTIKEVLWQMVSEAIANVEEMFCKYDPVVTLIDDGEPDDDCLKIHVTLDGVNYGGHDPITQAVNRDLRFIFNHWQMDCNTYSDYEFLFLVHLTSGAEMIVETTRGE